MNNKNNNNNNDKISLKMSYEPIKMSIKINTKLLIL